MVPIPRKKSGHLLVKQPLVRLRVKSAESPYNRTFRPSLLHETAGKTGAALRASDRAKLARFLQEEGFLLKDGWVTRADGKPLSDSDATQLEGLLRNWKAKYLPDDQ